MKMLEKISLKEILYFLLFLPMLFGGYGYLAGYTGYHWLGVHAFVVLALFALFLFGNLLVRIVKEIQQKRFQYKNYWFSFFLLSISISWFVLKEPGYKSFTKGMRDRVSQKVHMEEVKKWVQTYEVLDTIKGFDVYKLSDVKGAEFPGSLLVLKPWEVVVGKSEQGKWAKCMWGGSFMGSWGVIFLDFKYRKDKESTGYWLPVSDSCYVWHNKE